MNWFVFLFIVMCLGGIIFLKRYEPSKKISREQFLEKIREYFEGEIKPVEGEKNAFCVHFTYRDTKFMFEDTFSQGFKDEYNRAFLKVKVFEELFLNFSEKGEATTVRSEFSLGSKRADKLPQKKERIELPRELKNFEVQTNNPEIANKLLGDHRTAQIFSSFKNMNVRGYSSVALKIIDGVLMLEFYNSGLVNPSLTTLYNDVPSLENYLDNLLIVIKQLAS